MDKQKVEKLYEKFLQIISRKLGNSTTHTGQLNQICIRLFGKKYKGALPSDMQPTLKNKEMCILNLDKSNQGGSHWIGIRKEGGKLYVYDSFGRPHGSIIELSGSSIIDTELDAEQDVRETNCGQRACVALYMMHIFGAKYISTFL